MKLLGRTLNDLLEFEGQGRPLKEDEFYITVDGGKLIELKEYIKQFEEDE